MQRILQDFMKKKILGTSDAWSPKCLSHWPSEPGYYILDWFKVLLLLPQKSGGMIAPLTPSVPTALLLFYISRQLSFTQDWSNSQHNRPLFVCIYLCTQIFGKLFKVHYMNFFVHGSLPIGPDFFSRNPQFPKVDRKN